MGLVVGAGRSARLIVARDKLDMTASSHSRRSRAASKAGHVRYAAKSGIKFRALAAPRRTDVIQAPKPEHRIMRDELSDFEWIAIKPMLPNKDARR